MQKLLERIENDGPTEFDENEVSSVPNLFQQRSALFYTPSRAVPDEWVGSGKLNVTLPIPFPNWYEFYEIYGYRTPRLWVDLLQRATGKIRWELLRPASVRMIRYDTAIQPYHIVGGAKALLDALKQTTTGRADGRILYFFGAIVDDNPDDLARYEVDQRKIDDPAEARTEIVVEEFDPNGSVPAGGEIRIPSQ